MAIKRGVRHRDIISPNLFTLVLEDVFKNLYCEDKKMYILGERINNLKLNKTKLCDTFQEVRHETNKVAFEMNTLKTKFMRNKNANKRIHSRTIERQEVVKTNSYVCLGKEITIKELKTTALFALQFTNIF